MRPSKARSELSVGLACHLRWVTYEGAVRLRPARHTPEVGAGCGKAARPVLCGGRVAICVPTAIVISRYLPRERYYAAEAEAVDIVEGNMCGPVMRGSIAQPWSKTLSRTKGRRRNLGDLAFGRAVSIAPVRMGKVMSRSL